MTHKIKPVMGNKYLYCGTCKKYLMDKAEALALKKTNSRKEFMKYIDSQHLNNNKLMELQ